MDPARFEPPTCGERRQHATNTANGAHGLETKKSTYIHTSIDFGGKWQGRSFIAIQVGGAVVSRLNAVVI